MEGGLGPDIMSPVRQMGLNKSPLAHEVVRLGLDLRHPPRSMQLVEGSPAVDLTPQQYYRLQKLTGAAFKRMGEALVSSGAFHSLPDLDDSAKDYRGGKQRAILSAWTQAVKLGKAQLIQQDKSLQTATVERAENVGRAVSGRPERARVFLIVARALGGARRVDVDGDQRLGLVEHDGAAALGHLGGEQRRTGGHQHAQRGVVQPDRELLERRHCSVTVIAAIGKLTVSPLLIVFDVVSAAQIHIFPEVTAS